VGSKFWINITLALLTLVQRKHEREYQRLRKELEDRQRLFLDWAQRFEAKSGDSWHPNDDGAFYDFSALVFPGFIPWVQRICLDI